ncbi:MAG: saccharopine dehydrogenase NADP-binding domain-containing protein [Leptolyngbya sp. SIO1E4]|nr:saccharopine dehydrogenase NADP-binding domain-containing protein [Leptolyngbya sp. SIO1E4]
MTQKVLILGGQGRIGASVAADVLAHTEAAITVTGRQPTGQPLPPRCEFSALDLADQAAVEQAIARHTLVIHCAGPFSYRDAHVLETCIAQRVNYVDVADNPRYVQTALELRSAAQVQGVTAIVSTGVFPGISNSMVRQGIEQLDEADSVQLSYVVAGSGGAGVTVMRTTFLELQHPFQGWIDGAWQSIEPYSQREMVTFPAPYHRCGVYWFNTIEAMTLPRSFPVKTVITKFGSVPDVYNHLTWMMAHGVPKGWLRQPATVEFLARVSYRMTEISDRLSGIGIAMRADIDGVHNGVAERYTATFVHPDTAAAAGMGTGSVAQLLLSGELQAPGVWPVEQAVPTELFQRACQVRGLVVEGRVEGRG